MDSRKTLIYLSYVSLGIAVFAALPIIGRFIAGFGLAGLLGLFGVSFIGIMLTPEDFKVPATAAVFIFWIVYIISAIQGRFQ
jgi:hypothetical protein